MWWEVGQGVFVISGKEWRGVGLFAGRHILAFDVDAPEWLLLFRSETGMYLVEKWNTTVVSVDYSVSKYVFFVLIYSGPLEGIAKMYFAVETSAIKNWDPAIIYTVGLWNANG